MATYIQQMSHYPAKGEAMEKSTVRAIRGLFTLIAFLWLMPSVGKAFEFGVIGCQQYNAKSEAKFLNLMSDLNQSDLAFVVHVGDFRARRAGPCSDELFERRKEEFHASKHPFIYTPGDNEWTDCHKERAGEYDPVERLAKLRKGFFQGDTSLGQSTLQLTRQSNDPRYAKFRENVRWTHGDVVFVTLHIVGSNNNLGRTPEMDAEYSERNAANLAWMKQAFDLAKRDGSKAIVIFIQANPGFESVFPRSRMHLSLRAFGLKRSDRRKVVRTLQEERPEMIKQSGFSDFLKALKTETVAFGKPVVLMHADAHYFRIDKPMFEKDPSEKGRRRRGRMIENFTRVETYGNPETHWVRVIVDSKDRNVFTYKEGIVEKNLVKHKSN